MTSKSSSLPRQPPSCETKTSQDVVSSKPGKSSGGGSASFNRGSRRREPAQGSLSSGNPNKPGPRSKAGHNKRPPPRGNQNYYNDKSYKSFAIDNVDEAEEFEVGSIFNPGSKKQNYNHLLNFQYDKRGSTGNGRGNNHGGARNRGGHHKKQDTPRVKYDHTHYLQANCQFVVKSYVDYSVQLVDPDIIVDWNNIEQVELRTCGDDKEQTSCPICLFPPTAGKMAECGHVYCWSCILHYLALSDDDYRPCPICHKTITKAGLKSVKILSRHNYTTGDKVTMNLMKRERNSLFAVPVANNFLGNIPNVDQTDVDQKYMKLMTATPAQVISGIIDRERSELEQQWQEEKHQPESCFVQEAINLLNKKQSETEMEMKLSPSWMPHSPVELPDIKSLSLSSGDDSGVSDVSGSRHASGVSSDSLSSNEDVSDTTDHDGVGVGHLDISAVQSEKSSGKPRQVFYFYQSSDGQPIFLHALNVEMLVKQYGALENCPPVIEAEILEKESSVMTTELRDRLRYLKHLSVATNFEVAELDMSKLVSGDVVKIFRDQIETRKRRRNRKLRDEKRRERKIQHEESRLMGYPGSMIRVESEWTRPMSTTTSSQMENDNDQYPAMSDTQPTSSSSDVPSAISFANITRTKPTVQALAQANPQPSSTTTTWACLGSVKPLQVRRVIKADSDNDEDEDYVPPPPAASLGDTLAAALQAADGQAQGKGKGKKGGRNKGKTLVLSGAAVRKY